MSITPISDLKMRGAGCEKAFATLVQLLRAGYSQGIGTP
jgi:hypothetical protein